MKIKHKIYKIASAYSSNSQKPKMNKKAKHPLFVSLIISFILIFSIASYFVMAGEQTETVVDGIKTIENMGVSISAKIVEHCTYKPDGENDGYKICEAIIEGYNPNSYELTVDKPGDGFSSYFMLDKDFKVKDGYSYYYSNQFELYNEKLSNITELNFIDENEENVIELNITYYNVTRKRFVNWQPLAKDIKDTPTNNDINFAYKVKFEFPQYESASYNFSINYKKQDDTVIPIFLDPDITACGTLSTEGATYTQTANILDNALSVTCIIIDAENITYDGDGYTIRSNDNQAGISSTYFNTTIKDTDISMGDGSSWGAGIDLRNGASNSSIVNNTLNDGYVGIYLDNVDYSEIVNNTANSNSFGIYLTTCEYNNVTNNTANSNTNGGFSVFENSKNITLAENTADGNNVGVYVSVYVENITIENNTLTSNMDGVSLTNSPYNTIRNNTIHSNTRNGILIFPTSTNNLIENNTVYNSSTYEIEIQTSSNIIRYNNLTYNTRGVFITGSAATANYNQVIGNIISNYSSTAGSLGIVLESGASHTLIENNTLSQIHQIVMRLSLGTYNNITNNTFQSGTGGITHDDTNNSRIVNNKFINNTNYAIQFSNSHNNIVINISVNTSYDTGDNGAIIFSGSDNNLIWDSVLATNETNIISLSGTSTNNTFLNCSYTAKEVVAVGSELLRKWYFNGQTNFTHNSSAVPNANISAYNGTTFHFSVLSAADGSITTQYLTEYINTSTTAYYSNYTINATLTGWNINNPDNHTINLTTNLLQQFNISDYTAPPLTLVHPEAITYSINESLPLNYSVSDAESGLDTCWYNVHNSTDVEIANTTIVNCLNTTFNLPGGDIDYNLTLYVNDSNNNINSSRIEFGIRLTAPSIVLYAPTNHQNLSNGTNIYFNFTATDTDGLDTCQLWGNWTGTWHKNYSWVGPTSGTQNYTTQNISDVVSIWNIWCNDTTTQGGWALNNYTFTIDETSPNATITTANNTEVVDTLSITIDYNISDTHLEECYFTLRTSGGLLHNYPENTSLNCAATSRSISALYYGTFVLRIWGEDYAGNLGDDNVTLITKSSGSPGGGGGVAIEDEGEEEEERSFCGDGICQLEGNDYGVLENFYNCPSDCPGFDLDELINSFTIYCWDRDPSTICFFQTLFATVPGIEEEALENITIYKDGEVCIGEVCERLSGKTIFSNCVDDDLMTPCFWQTNAAILSLFLSGSVLFGLTFIKVKTPGKVGKVNPYKYVFYQVKKRGKRRKW